MRPITAFSLALIVSAVVPGQTRIARKADAETVRTAERVLAKLEARVREVKFDKTPLREALDWVGRQLGVNVWVRWKVLDGWGIRRDEPITLHMRDVRLGQVLRMILSDASADVRLDFGVIENILVVGTRDSLGWGPVTLVYDVGPLLARRARFGAAPNVRPAEPGGTARIEMAPEPPPVDPAATEQLAESLVEVIQSTIEPDAWAVNGGEGTIRYWNGRLLVYADLSTHLALRKLLADLEATR